MTGDTTPLNMAAKIGLIGDVHGDLGAILDAATFMAERGVNVLLALGDVGLLWPGENGQQRLTKLSKRLADRGQTFYWVEGNHDDHHRLNQFPIAADGLRHLSERIVHLPRGYRTTLASGKSLAALGGANSIDRFLRTSASWWAEESITDDDLNTLGDEHADILVGHDAPLDILSLDRSLAATDRFWSQEALDYARQGRRMFHRGFLQTNPMLYLGGHYHQPIDEVVGYITDTITFASRIVVMDMVQHPDSACAAILDTDTLALEFFTLRGQALPAGPAQVVELTEKMSGRWLIHTIGSHHILDLDRRTIERRPGPNSIATTSDEVHYLRSLNTCRIGERGRWTMKGDYLTDYYWHASSAIRHIEPLTDADTKAIEDAIRN
ncbi:metallophosphoesterase family protein [Leifsonia sp. Root112D2]|uniref:metallophosphoesterase family protein n=1 Tax=Leifsonia sp. Root112D2 TaxID=1736426 RepID=UPI0006FE6FC3|nr:metallophosphoesterase [Leifsonia sp. Root112D2]KQV05046.1 hypothetical protein ASC63_14625 [Leifsonia sp. Root112D2]